MIKITGLFIYPLKGGVGISLDTVQLGPMGPTNDRRWMVVDENHRLVTQREIGRLALLRATPAGHRLRLEGPDMTPLEVRPTEVLETVEVWNDQVDAVYMGDSAAGWCSRFLGAPVRLVHMAESWSRRTDPDYDPIGARVSFADGYPLLLISEESLGDLNGRLVDPLPMNRFRPNVVVAGAEPFEEDQWRRFTIGSLAFDMVKLCARCTVPTTDQATGERSKEPLKTLATYRKQGSGVMFGVNVVHRSLGTLHVGDEIAVITRSAE
ncbi:MAG: MOSC N-terminal beta barrel domain-containing protein [Gemmatimonadota bacterium]